jgi:antitoxin component of MazEF toxin-antitoxin module
VRKVGDSLGILIPSRVVQELNARPGQALHVVLPPRVDWTDLWGKLRTRATARALLERTRTERD